MAKKCIIKCTKSYKNGATHELYVLHIGAFVEYTPKMEEAKRYFSKISASEDIKIIRNGQRSRSEKFEVVEI